MKPSRNLWPYGLIGVFVLFFCGMATVVVIAATHQENLVNNNYYEQELKFQSRLDAIQRTQQTGATVRLDAAAQKLIIAVPAGHCSQNFSGKIILYRANAPELDQEIALTPAPDGTQALSTSSLSAGSWHVRVSWTAGGLEYYLENKIVL